MLKHVWDDSVPPLLREPALFDGNGLPRYWATIWSLYQTADLASSTKQKQLSYVEALYQFSESSSYPGALDDAIARVDVVRSVGKHGVQRVKRPSFLHSIFV